MLRQLAAGSVGIHAQQSPLERPIHPGVRKSEPARPSPLFGPAQCALTPLDGRAQPQRVTDRHIAGRLPAFCTAPRYPSQWPIVP